MYKRILFVLIILGSLNLLNAMPLNDVLKNVDVKGAIRLRLHNYKKNSISYNRWRTNAVLIFNKHIFDNFSVIVRNSAESDIYSNATQLNPYNEKSSIDSDFFNELLYISEKYNKADIILGKIPCRTSVTSEDIASFAHGAGAEATYKLSSNIKAAVLFTDTLKQKGKEAVMVHMPEYITDDLYAADIKYLNRKFKSDIWLYKLSNQMRIITASFNLNCFKDIAFHIDYANGKEDNFKTKNYYNVYTKIKNRKIITKIGYVYTDNHSSPVVLAYHSPIGKVIPTANYFNIANDKDKTSFYGQIKYLLNRKAVISLAYQFQNDRSGLDNNLNEYTVETKYRYNKKTSFFAYFDVCNFNIHSDNEKELLLQMMYKI